MEKVHLILLFTVFSILQIESKLTAENAKISPKSLIFIGEFNQTLYYIDTLEMSWSTSRFYCSDYPGDFRLAHFSTRDEALFFKERAPVGVYWTCGVENRMPNPREDFTWLYASEPINYNIFGFRDLNPSALALDTRGEHLSLDKYSQFDKFIPICITNSNKISKF